MASNIGQALKAVREARGLSLEQIAEITRVRSGYLAAIENFDIASLPSRPFAIGYVRAYAQALNLDGDAAVSSFKAEAPDADNELRTPIGVRHNRPRRFGALAGVAGVLLLALIGWNVARHTMGDNTPAKVVRPAVHAVTVAEVRAPAGPSQIGAPLPPPPEANTPKAYETPGMPPPGSSAVDAAHAMVAPAAPAKPAPPPVAADIGGPFIAAGPVYGAPAPGAGVILQAKASTSLVVRGQGGAVYFAKQLAPGEAWRAPAIKGLTVEASSPNAVEAYVGGVSRGLLADPQTALSKFGV